jgi:hypothetical protein
MVNKEKNTMVVKERFTKSFLDILKGFPDSKRCFLGFIGVGASYEESILETAKYYQIDPEYEEYS